MVYFRNKKKPEEVTPTNNARLIAQLTADKEHFERLDGPPKKEAKKPEAPAAGPGAAATAPAAPAHERK